MQQAVEERCRNFSDFAEPAQPAVTKDAPAAEQTRQENKAVNRRSLPALGRANLPNSDNSRNTWKNTSEQKLCENKNTG